MKFKKWKRHIQNENFDIPYVYNRIKSTAYSRVIPNKVTYNFFNFKIFKKLSHSLAPLLLIFILVVIISAGYTKSLKNSISGTNSLSYFNNQDEIQNLLIEKREEEKIYQEKYREKTWFFKGWFMAPKTESEGSNDKYQDTSKYSTNIQIDDDNEGDIVKSEGNIIYYLSPSNFNVINTNEGNMSLIYSENFDDYFNNYYHYTRMAREIYLTEDYITIIYTKANVSNNEVNYSKYEINIFVYDKENYTKVYSYKTFGTYLESRMINDNLYLITSINISGYLDKDIPTPIVYENDQKKDISPSDISYINEYLGESYTIISHFRLDEEINSKEIIQLSFNYWNNIYATNESIYLINTHFNYNDNMEYGYYTSIIKYRITNSGIKYSSSYTYKGNAINNLSFDEYNGYLRVVTTVKNYQVNKNLIETDITIQDKINKILVFKEIDYSYGNELQLIGELNFGLDEENAEIKSVRFEKDNVFVVTHSSNNPLYKISLHNPTQPKIISCLPITGYSANFHNIEKNTALELGYSDSNTSKYKLSIYTINENNINLWDNGNYYIRYNLFEQTSDSLNVEALNNYKAIYQDKINNLYYFGFSVHELNYWKGNYLLFIIDTLDKSYESYSFSHHSNSKYGDSRMMIKRLISIHESDFYFYSISDGLITSYDQNFNKIYALELPTSIY